MEWADFRDRAATDNVVQANGQEIELLQGQYTSLMILGTSTSGFPATNLFYVYYTNGTYDTITQAFSDWKAGYTGTLGTTAPGESVALTMNTYLSPSAVVNQHVDLYGYVFPVNPDKTVAYIQLPDDPSVIILAIDEVNHPEQVNLGDATDSASPAFDGIGISTNLDPVVTGDYSTLSANALGNTVTWNGQTFDIGPATVSVPDEVMASGYPPIELPQGNYTSVQFLAEAPYGGPLIGTFYVDYTDGTRDVFTLSISAWGQGYIGAGTTGPDEAIAASMSYFNTSTGAQDTETYLYGYVLQTNPDKTVEDLRTPNNAGIQILAVDVVDQPEQVNLGDATNDASPADDAVGISVDSRTDVEGGVSTYSANALGNTVTWNGQTFDLGPATVNVDDEVMGSGYPPIELPQGNYTSIQFLGMEAANVPTSGTF